MKAPCFHCKMPTITLYHGTHISKYCPICDWEGYIVKIPEAI